MTDVTAARALTLALRRNGDHPALHFRDRTISHAELDELANRIAEGLTSRGLSRGDRVGVVLPNVPEYVAVAIACAKGAFTMVTLNYRFTSEEFAQQLWDCDAKAVIYASRFGPAIRKATAELPAVQRIGFGEAGDGDADTLESLAENASGNPPSVEVSEDDLFYLGYTSGTTGRPKGAMVSQRNRALAYHYWALEFGIGTADVALHAGPFHHTAPFTFVLTQLFLGGQVVILDHFDPLEMAKATARHGVTWGFLVPYMLDRLVAAADDISGYDLSSLRFVISGASPLPTRTKRELLNLLPGIGLHEFYGATEAGVIANLRPEDQLRKTRCVGRPVFDTEIEVRDAGGEPVATGEVGDVWMRGPTMFSGYYKAPEKNRAVFDGDWCTLGDVGRMDAEGYLYLLDRRKDVIKSGGVNIFPVEIEEVLRAAPGVTDAAVVGIPDPTWGEAVHAVIVPADNSPVQEDALRTYCRSRLAGYKVPKSFEAVPELPRNANGKVLKRVLRERATGE